MKQPFIFQASLTLIIIFLGGCHSEKSDNKTIKQKLADIRVEGVIAAYSKLDQTITLSGTLKPFEETVLMPEVQGRVVSINLPEGGQVKRGTLLVKLFDGDLQAQLQKAVAQLQITEETLKRQNELIKVSGISQSDYDQTKLQVNAIKADIEVLKTQINKTEVRAPFDGTIGLRNISIGAQVTTSTALVTIRDVNQLKLDFSVPEKYSRGIRAGTKLKFTVQGDEAKHEATVIATEQGIEANTRNLNARATVKSNPGILTPGAFATVELHLSENKQAILIPTQAIIPQERNKKLIVSSQGKAKFVTVKTGIRTTSQIEVLSGINPGDTVVITGLLFLRPDAKLKFSKVKSDTL